MSKPVELSSVKEGSYMIIDGEPCRIVEYDKSKPGKHGSAKARVVGMGLFDSVKRSFVSPVSANVEVPIIEKKSGQVLSLTGDSVQIMDLANFSVFETSLTQAAEVRDRLALGAEIEYWVVLGRKKIIRVKS